METWLKAAFAALFAALIVLVVRVARRLRRRPGGRIDQSAHELPLLRALRPVLGLLFYAALFDWLFPGTRLGFAVVPLPSSVRWLGALVAALGVGLIGWAFEALGPTYRGGVGLWDDHELVTDGPYRFVRHPIYDGFVVTMAGIALLSASWLVGLSGLVLTGSVPLVRVPVEERELEERFGDRYRTFRDRTGRFLPRP